MEATEVRKRNEVVVVIIFILVRLLSVYAKSLSLSDPLIESNQREREPRPNQQGQQRDSQDEDAV